MKFTIQPLVLVTAVLHLQCNGPLHQDLILADGTGGREVGEVRSHSAAILPIIWALGIDEPSEPLIS
jgi:hypothetical protein